MKRLIIGLVILSVGRLASAQNLQLFTGQTLDYQLELVTIKRLYDFLGLFGSFKGQASFSVNDDHYEIYTAVMEAYVVKNENKNTYWLNNQARLVLNHNKLQEVTSILSDSTRQFWQVNEQKMQVFYYANDCLIDSLAIDGHQARDVITAALQLIDPAQAEPGKTLITSFFTHDSVRHSRWETLSAYIEPEIKTIKVTGKKITCYQYVFKTAEKINLGGEYTLGEPVVWVAKESGKPIKVKVKLYYGFFPVGILTGKIELK